MAVDEVGDGGVGERDDLYVGPTHGVADARAMHGSGIDFVGGNAGDGQGLGGAVGAMEFSVGQKGARALPERRGHRGARAQHAVERGQGDLVREAVVADFFPERGRAEGVGDAFLLDGLHDFRGVEGGGAAGVDLRHDRGHAERGVKEREDGQKGQIDFAGRDGVGLADEAHLGLEHPVFIAHAFRRAGGAAGEKHRGQVGGVARG